MKQELKSKGMSMKTVNENATKDMLKEALRSDKDNIFIPTSGKNVMLIKILPQLILLVRDTPEHSVAWEFTHQVLAIPFVIIVGELYGSRKQCICVERSDLMEVST